MQCAKSATTGEIFLAFELYPGVVLRDRRVVAYIVSIFVFFVFFVSAFLFFFFFRIFSYPIVFLI